MVYGAYLLAPVTWLFGPLEPWLLLPLAHAPARAPRVVRTVRNHADGPSLNAALARTGMLQLVFCVLLSAGLLLSRVSSTFSRLRRPCGRRSFRRPGSLEARELLLVRLEDATGRRASARPLRFGYDGVDVEDVQARSRTAGEVIARADDAARRALLAECARLAVLPPAIAAIDLALWDLEGRRAGAPGLAAARRRRRRRSGRGKPLDRRRRIARSAAGEALAATRAGYEALKLKVGLGDDAGRLAAVRAAAGPDVAIRLDANGAWTVEQAVASLAALEPAGIELCEEPVSGPGGSRAALER